MDLYIPHSSAPTCDVIAGCECNIECHSCAEWSACAPVAASWTKPTLAGVARRRVYTHPPDNGLCDAGGEQKCSDGYRPRLEHRGHGDKQEGRQTCLRPTSVPMQSYLCLCVETMCEPGFNAYYLIIFWSMLFIYFTSIFTTPEAAMAKHVEITSVMNE